MPSASHSAPADRRGPRWARTLAASAAALAVLAATVAAALAARGEPGYATGPGRVLVKGADYSFSPDRLTWRVGERVTLTFRNDSAGRPGKPHELMVGRTPASGPTVFGPALVGGFETDFFDGVAVELVRARNLEMVMPGGASLSGAAAGMAGMEMGGGPADGEEGFMISLLPGGEATIGFVVPDKPGRWELGCFAQTRQHYENGMRGWVTVELA